jgi:hypothetical protein
MVLKHGLHLWGAVTSHAICSALPGSSVIKRLLLLLRSHLLFGYHSMSTSSKKSAFFDACALSRVDL